MSQDEKHQSEQNVQECDATKTIFYQVPEQKLF